MSNALGAGFRFERLVVSTGCGRNCRLVASGFVGVLVVDLMEK